MPALHKAGDESTIRTLCIFVASPSDVGDERMRLAEVVSGINTSGIAAQLGLRVELLRWDTHVPPDIGSPQGIVFETLGAKDWDIFIGILWTRFGTPTGRINPRTGQSYRSGTEEEFEAALAERNRRNNGSPRIMIYPCLRPVGPKTDTVQLGLVQQFFLQFEPDGENPGLSYEFTDADEFERLARNHLEQVIQIYGVARVARPSSQDAAAVSNLTVEKPGLLRYAFDRCLPRFHTWLSTRAGVLPTPPEWRVLHNYLTD